MSASSNHANQDKKIFGISIGAEPKKTAALGGLLLVLAIVWWVMRDPSEDSAATAAAAHATPPAISANGQSPLPDPGSTAAAAARVAANRGEAPGGPRRQGSRQALTQAVKEFKVSLKRNPDDPIDPSQTDPTIRVALLSKVQGVGMAGGGRSLFEFGSMPPTVEEAKLLALKVNPKKLVAVYGPPILPPLPPPAPPPPPPPIPLKYYGFVHSLRPNERRAFFMENDDIFIASEGDMIKKRYKLIKLGVNTAVLEDTQIKNNQQTIKLEVEAAEKN